MLRKLGIWASLPKENVTQNDSLGIADKEFGDITVLRICLMIL